MFTHGNGYSPLSNAIVMVLTCLCLANDIAWSQPSSGRNNTSSVTTLAAESRLKPFSESHRLDFKKTVMADYIARELKEAKLEDAVSSDAPGHLYFSLVEEKETDLENGLRNLLLRLDTELAINGMTVDSIVKQTVFLSDYSHKAKCMEIIGKHYGRAPPATSYIIQPPLGGGIVSMEVMAVKGAIVEQYENVSVLHEKGVRWAYVAGIEPDNSKNSTYEEKALECFDKLKTALKSTGFGLEDIVRTWLYVSGILNIDENGGQRYQQLNDARDHCFATADSGRPTEFRSKLPVASTGIGMLGGSLVFECVAISKGSAIEITPLKNPRQINSYEYSPNVLAKGAREKRSTPKFSRGMLVSTPGYKTVFVSGTASVIGEEVVNKGDVEAQTRTIIENIKLVLKEGGLALSDVLQPRVYIKNKEDYKKIRSIVERAWPGIPCLYVIGDVCRAEWMVEIEAVATGAKSRAPSTSPAADRAATQQIAAQNEAARMHAGNLKYAPNIPQNTILCHIIADSILPEGQKSMLKRLEQNMRGSEYSEKVVSLSIKNPNKFIEELKALMAKQRDLYEEYALQFDVACPNTEIVKMVLESKSGIKALAFDPCKKADADIAQIEGIILALRALNSGKIENLREAFRILTGKELSRELSNITNIDEFIKRVTFALPASQVIDYNHGRQLNEIIRKNIEAAA